MVAWHAEHPYVSKTNGNGLRNSYIGIVNSDDQFETPHEDLRRTLVGIYAKVLGVSLAPVREKLQSFNGTYDYHTLRTAARYVNGMLGKNKLHEDW